MLRAGAVARIREPQHAAAQVYQQQARGGAESDVLALLETAR
jgi:hypothetical protein